VLRGGIIICALVLAVLAAGAQGSPARAATTTNRPPSTAIVDPADTPGPLDLRTVHVTQSLGSIRWAFKTQRPFRLIDMSAGSIAKTACLQLSPAGHAALAQRLCITGTSVRAHALYRSAVNPGGVKSMFIPATITRLNSTQMTVTFSAKAVGLTPPIKADFQVNTVWRATTACPTATPCRDQAPSPGFAAFRLDSYRATGCVPKGTSYRFFGTTANHAMALTFDDGPSAYTSAVLAALKRYGVHATFFEVGDEVGPRAANSRAIIAAGDAIGDHSWSHPILTSANTRSQMAAGKAAIQKATGYTPCIARVPYGIAPASVVNTIRSLGMLTIQWDIDPRDWSLPGSAAIARNVLANAHNGAIAIMHDGGGNRSETVAALGTIIPTLLARGYHLVTVPQLLGLQTAYTYSR
jgi:peptidoglycan/xylan/chitin deacetylase (PgdA/CDA1 family)